jgi:Type IV secretory system Conjugative DNA transfer
VFNRGGLIAASSGLLGALSAIGGSLWRARQSKLITTYGSARWATSRDVREACLTRPAGVFLGRVRAQYLRHDGPEHVLAFAPTRSGKGVGLVVPTLLSWRGSAVVHDIKGENWQLTAGWRSRFSNCLLFNPTDARSAAYNPLMEVRRGVQEVRDVQNIADILVDPEGALERRNHWEKTSHALLVGAILHVLYAEADKTLTGVANFLSNPAQPFEVTLRAMMLVRHLGATPHPVVASAAREVLNKSDNERSGVLSTAMSFLGLYRDPTVAAVTRRCDWRIADLVEGRHPVSLYLVVPPSDISRTKPLIRLLLNQIGRRLTLLADDATADSPCKQAPSAEVAAPAGHLIDPTKWTVCKSLVVNLSSDFPKAMAVLLRSTSPQGVSGVGEPQFGIDILLASDGKVIYRFTASLGTPQFFIDGFLEIRALTEHGDKAVLFHSGEVAATDSWRAEHVIYLVPGELFAQDVAPRDFGDSWRHTLRWIHFRGVPLALIAEPINPAGASDPHMCHSCPKYYQYFVYRWKPHQQSFVLLQSIQSEHDIDAATDPLQADMSFIEQELAKRWSQ